MLIFLSPVDFLCQTEVGEAVAELARSPLHSLRGGPGVVRVEGQLQTAREKVALYFQSCCIQTHSRHFQASSRDLVFFDVPSEVKLISSPGSLQGHMHLKVLPNSLQRGESLSLLKPAWVGCDSCSEAVRILF